MTDQTPTPKFAVSPGEASTNPNDIAEVLRARAEQSEEQSLLGEQPIRFAGQIAPDEAAAGVTAEELKPAPDEKPKIEQQPIGLPDATQAGAPPWVKLPAGIVFPRGRIVYFLRFEGSWTNVPWKGERQAIFWAMSVGDKKLALQRSMGDPIRAADEMVKSCIRAIDGTLVTGADASLDIWWEEVGEKVRGLLTRVHAQAHFLKPTELDHFLKDCIAARTAG